MRIGLINENSQADKNQLIYDQLKLSADINGHQVINFGKYSSEDKRILSYTHIGLEASILIETQMVNFIVTGCGTGQGAAISCNSFPNLICGVINSPLDVYLFGQINAGNVISLAYAEEFGWGSEIKIKQIFDTCFSEKFGIGYPLEYSESQRKSRQKMVEIKKSNSDKIIEIYKRFDKKELRQILDYAEFREAFNMYAVDNKITAYIRTVIE